MDCDCLNSTWCWPGPELGWLQRKGRSPGTHNVPGMSLKLALGQRNTLTRTSIALVHQRLPPRLAATDSCSEPDFTLG